MKIERAIEVFVHGFAFTRSYTHPYLVERLAQGVWRMYDADRQRGDYRGEEFVGYDVPPAELDALARKHTRGHYKVCMIRAMEESDTIIRVEFEALRYRLMATEAFMVHDLKQIETVAEPFPVIRVTTEEQAQVLAKAARSRQILPQHLKADPPPRRQYMALDGETVAGWVGSIAACGCAWCTNMFVEPTYRRKGLARALMTRMLADDKAAGAQANVLLASHAGSKLYPTVGYETIGELLLYTLLKSVPHL